VTHQAVARDLLAIFCGVQGLATAFVDLNWNHARNSAWTGHARFHVVWQTTAFVALAFFEIALVIVAGPFAKERFYVAAGLAGIPMLGFFVAFFGRPLYGGMLADANGLPPIAIRLLGAECLIEINLAAEIAGMLALIAIVLLFRQPRALF